MRKQYEDHGRESRGKAINFGESAGGKAEESHLRKLDREMLRKNCTTKYVEKKSLSTFKTITRSEFQRRRSSFENLTAKNEAKGNRGREDVKIEDFPERRNVFAAKEPPRKARSLESLQTSYDFPSAEKECLARENKMTETLKEIHDLIEKMQEMTKKLTGSDSRKPISTGSKAGKEWKTSDFVRRHSIANKSPSGSPSPDVKNERTFTSTVYLNYMSMKQSHGRLDIGSKQMWNLKGKLVPIRFTTTLKTNLGSGWKTFTEEIVFQNRYMLVAAGGCSDRKQTL